MFISLQHPNSSNADTVSDAAGKPVVFNRGTTMVIANRAFLGQGLPVDVTSKLRYEKSTFEMTVFPNPIRLRQLCAPSNNFPKGLEVPVAGSVVHGALVPSGNVCRGGWSAWHQFQPFFDGCLPDRSCLRGTNASALAALSWIKPTKSIWTLQARLRQAKIFDRRQGSDRSGFALYFSQITYIAQKPGRHNWSCAHCARAYR